MKTAIFSRKHLVAISIPLLIATIIGCSTPPTPESENLGSDEWVAVQEAVNSLLSSVDPPMTNLRTDDRVDWDTSATSPARVTRNMTRQTSNDGGIPLLSFTESGSNLLSVSSYLGKDRTLYFYWIDSVGGVHIAE